MEAIKKRRDPPRGDDLQVSSQYRLLLGGGGLVLALIVGWIARNASSSSVPCKLVEIWSMEI
jgi:hypothetical protein